jgi:hypothetical protein
MPPNYFSSKNLANYLAFFLPKVRPHGKNTVALKCKMGHNHSGFLGIPGGWRQHLGKKVRRWPKMGNWGPIRGGGGSAFSGAAGGTARLFMSR